MATTTNGSTNMLTS